MWTYPPSLSSEAVFPPCRLHLSPSPTSSLRQPSTTHQELHPAPPIHPCNLAPRFTPPGSGRPPGLTRTHHFPAERQQRGRLTYNQKTALTSWFSLTSTQTQILSVERGMTAPVSQICFRNQTSLSPVICSNFVCTTATCLILNFQPATPPEDAIPLLCPPTPLPHPDPVKDCHGTFMGEENFLNNPDTFLRDRKAPWLQKSFTTQRPFRYERGTYC